jgi:hypothetical protein
MFDVRCSTFWMPVIQYYSRIADKEFIAALAKQGATTKQGPSPVENLKPQTSNLKPQTSNLKPRTLSGTNFAGNPFNADERKDRQRQWY